MALSCDGGSDGASDSGGASARRGVNETHTLPQMCVVKIKGKKEKQRVLVVAWLNTNLA